MLTARRVSWGRIDAVEGGVENKMKSSDIRTIFIYIALYYYNLSVCICVRHYFSTVVTAYFIGIMLLCIL